MTYKEFRTSWVLNPSKEMIVEKEIKIAYEIYLTNLGKDGKLHSGLVSGSRK